MGSGLAHNGRGTGSDTAEPVDLCLVRSLLSAFEEHLLVRSLSLFASGKLLFRNRPTPEQPLELLPIFMRREVYGRRN